MPTAATNEGNFILFRIKKSRIICLHHHHDVAGGILSLVTCSGPINSREAFWGVVVGFVAHSVDISCRGADKSLARPTSRCILFDGENISFDASLVIYINRTNIPPIMIINTIYETQNLLSLNLVSFLVGLRTYQHPSMFKELQKVSPCTV